MQAVPARAGAIGHGKAIGTTLGCGSRHEVGATNLGEAISSTNSEDELLGVDEAGDAGIGVCVGGDRADPRLLINRAC